MPFSGDLPPGSEVAGFRIERVAGRGSRATVYEATQLSLGRRVALKVMHDRDMAERVRRLDWPDHLGAVTLYGTGDSEHGPWLAMRYFADGTLSTWRAPLDEVAAALAAAHEAGIVHGDVSAGNVLVDDGRAYLSDFGLVDGTAEEDRAALAALIDAYPPPSAAHGRAPLVAAAALVVAVIVATAVLSLGGGSDGGAGPAAAPAAPAGTRALGSDLSPGAVDSVDCAGRTPNGASLACTISQRELGGRVVVVPRDGTITSWAVRGARGTLALQVLRGHGDRLLQVDKSGDVTIPAGADSFSDRTDLAVAKGDRVALQVYPGAAVGVRRGSAGATTDRWFGPLLEPERLPERPPGSGLDDELLLRVDISGRTGPSPVAAVSGDAAPGATAGRRLDSLEVPVGGGEIRTVAIVVLGGGGVAADLFDGTGRRARIAVAGADGRGQLVALTGGDGEVRVRWSNPGGREIERRIAVTPDRLR